MHVDLVSEAQHDSLIELLAELHAFYNEGARVPRELVREHLLGNLLAPGSPHQLVVASTDARTVVGLAAITWVFSLVDFAPEQRRHCQLKELYVKSGHRSAGAGRALMAWVAAQAIAKGCHRIDWPVKATNARGIAFYEGLGAFQVAERLSYRLLQPALGELAAFTAPA
ncbi:GNAT family N-acetyltransferase [Variovorax boronicumulans]|uniref:GNAT family N-acetyltransferase n=1 Tax=Variovorax boronicumulans TaxID=436515 RepID=UPI0012E5D636|nr:GNAT family N-acetyltransferase [Variovorax boronicumulans]GER11821.1 N-acetyltransferase [Variovorax boronicumulans]